VMKPSGLWDEHSVIRWRPVLRSNRCIEGGQNDILSASRRSWRSLMDVIVEVVLDTWFRFELFWAKPLRADAHRARRFQLLAELVHEIEEGRALGTVSSPGPLPTGREEHDSA
jgi:hypothetical protein